MKHIFPLFLLVLLLGLTACGDKKAVTDVLNRAKGNIISCSKFTLGISQQSSHFTNVHVLTSPI